MAPSSLPDIRCPRCAGGLACDCLGALACWVGSVDTKWSVMFQQLSKVLGSEEVSSFVVSPSDSVDGVLPCLGRRGACVGVEHVGNLGQDLGKQSSSALCTPHSLST